MTRALRRTCLAAVVLPAIVLASSSDCRALDPVSTIRSQVAAAVYTQQWGQILWGLVTTQTGTETPSFGDPVFNPDGSVTQSFVAADGTETILTAYPDGSAALQILLPNGVSQSVWQSPAAFDGVSRTTTNWTIEASDGLSVSYTSVVDDRGTIFDISDDITQLLGSSVLPDGITQTFSVLMAGGYAELLSTQSDGSIFSLTVPLNPPDFVLPDFSQEANGTYTDPSFTVNFALTSTPQAPSRWAALLCDAGWGITGTFSLNDDFSGSGQLEGEDVSGQTLVALASWTQYGEIDVYSLSGDNLYMGPSGAALDFLIHRWQTLTALLAPGPGISVTPPNGSRRGWTRPRLQPRRPLSLGRRLRALQTPLPLSGARSYPREGLTIQDQSVAGKTAPRGSR